MRLRRLILWAGMLSSFLTAKPMSTRRHLVVSDPYDGSIHLAGEEVYVQMCVVGNVSTVAVAISAATLGCAELAAQLNDSRPLLRSQNGASPCAPVMVRTEVSAGNACTLTVRFELHEMP
jgi:hypothetical protein